MEGLLGFLSFLIAIYGLYTGYKAAKARKAEHQEIMNVLSKTENNAPKSIRFVVSDPTNDVSGSKSESSVNKNKGFSSLWKYPMMGSILGIIVGFSVYSNLSGSLNERGSALDIQAQFGILVFIALCIVVLRRPRSIYISVARTFFYLLLIILFYGVRYVCFYEGCA